MLVYHATLREKARGDNDYPNEDEDEDEEGDPVP